MIQLYYNLYTPRSAAACITPQQAGLPVHGPINKLAVQLYAVKTWPHEISYNMHTYFTSIELPIANPI